MGNTHTDNFEGTSGQTAVLDHAMIALRADLQAKGPLHQTPVVLDTEFGRTPRINDSDGWDHDNKTCAYLLVGAVIDGCHTHSDNFEGTPQHAAVLDQAMSALLADLQAKGLLGQTVVVLGTEFGRTTRNNDDDGRDHHK